MNRFVMRIKERNRRGFSTLSFLTCWLDEEDSEPTGWWAPEYLCEEKPLTNQEPVSDCYERAK